MNPQKALKSALVTLTVFLMLISTAACTTTQAPATSAPAGSASAAAEQTTTPQPTPPPVTLSLLVSTIPALEFKNTSVGQEIQKRLNVTVTNIVADDTKVKTMLSSNDLPDIPMLDSGKYAKQAIEGGQVVALDDLVAAGGQDITQNIPKTVDYSKKNISNGTGKLYFLPTNVGPDNMGFEPSIGFCVRWDYYKDLGFPAINNEYDLLNVLKQMVDAHPTTPEGKKVYGVGGWGADMGGLWYYYMPMASVYGYMNFTGDGYLVKVDTNEIINNFTDPDSPMWKTLAFFNKANQMGIFDQDTFTAKWGDFSAKADAGQELYAAANWAYSNINGKLSANGQGWEVLPLDWGYQMQGGDKIGYASSCYAISNNCKNPERAMALLNFLFSCDGSRIALSGVENQQWTIDSGIPKATQQFLDDRSADNDAFKKSGVAQTAVGISPGLSKWFLNPVDKTEMDLSEAQNAYAYRTSKNAFLTAYCQHYGVTYPAEIFLNNVKAGKSINQAKFNDMIPSAVVPAPDDIHTIDLNLTDIMTQAVSNLVLAKTDADFKTLKDQTIANLKSNGADTSNTWWMKAWADAKAAIGAN